MYNSKYYYREMCFELATCADFSISDFGELSNSQISNHVITKKRSYADLDDKITEGFEISDFGKDFKISVKISKDFNQKRTRFQGVSSPSLAVSTERVLYQTSEGALV